MDDSPRLIRELEGKSFPSAIFAVARSSTQIFAHLRAFATKSPDPFANISLANLLAINDSPSPNGWSSAVPAHFPRSESALPAACVHYMFLRPAHFPAKHDAGVPGGPSLSPSCGEPPRTTLLLG